MKLLLGADPEVFVKQNGCFVSAYNLVPGTKAEPHPVNNGAVQVDGMALEFNINPADSEDTFVFNITDVMSQLEAMVPGYDVCAEPVAEFTEEYMSTQCLDAKRLGCEADYNAWTGKENTPPDAEVLFRTAAAHVHFGWTDVCINKQHISMCEDIVKQSDFFLALPSLLFDDDVRRRELYGKAGAFRPKTYGMEYRVLSNKWLKSRSLISWVYRASQACFESMQDGLLSDKYGDIQDIINTSDVPAALEIIKAENLLVPEAV